MTRKSAVFISHTREDGRWADAIADALEDAGMSVWRESWTLRTGETWQRELRRALDRSSTVLVLVSSKAADSKWMQFEAGAALGASFGSKKRVVPVYLSHRGRDYLPLLRGLESIDLAGLHPEQGAKRVADYLASAA